MADGTVLQTLRARRSVARVTPERPPRSAIECVIEAAGWAPNHHRSEPWRFFVLAGRARDELGDVLASSAAGRLTASDGPEATALIERARRKPQRAPVIIVVAAVPSLDVRVHEIEEVAATAAAVQNMLLAAHSLGLGAMWRTGQPAYDPAVKRFLGLPEGAHILAFVYVGYPDMPPSSERERHALHRATWLGWDE